MNERENAHANVHENANASSPHKILHVSTSDKGAHTPARDDDAGNEATNTRHDMNGQAMDDELTGDGPDEPPRTLEAGTATVVAKTPHKHAGAAAVHGEGQLDTNRSQVVPPGPVKTGWAVDPSATHIKQPEGSGWVGLTHTDAGLERSSKMMGRVGADGGLELDDNGTTFSVPTMEEIGKMHHHQQAEASTSRPRRQHFQLPPLTPAEIDKLNHITSTSAATVMRGMTDTAVSAFMCRVDFDSWDDLVDTLRANSSFVVNDKSHEEIIQIVHRWDKCEEDKSLAQLHEEQQR